MPVLIIPDISFLSVMENLAAPVWIFDLDRHAIWWGNAAAQNFWKTGSLEELRNRDFSSDSATVRQRLHQMYVDPEIPRRLQETWTLYPAEKPVSVTVRFQPVRIEQGRRAILVEVTSKSEVGPDIHSARIEETVRYSGVIMSMFSLSGVLLAQNAASFDCYGAGREDGRDLVHRLGESDTMSALFDALKRSDVFEAEIEVRAKDMIRTHRVTAHRGRDPATGETVAVLSEHDISDLVQLRRQLSDLNATLEQRVAERNASLKLSEERFSLAMRGRMTACGTTMSRPARSTSRRAGSTCWVSALTMPPPDLDTILSRVHPDDRELVETAVILPVPGDTKAPEVEFRIRHKNNHWVDILSRAFLIVHDDKVARIVGTHIDISERKHSERALRRLREILIEGSEALPVGVAYYDHEFKLVMNNTLYKDHASGERAFCLSRVSGSRRSSGTPPPTWRGSSVSTIPKTTSRNASVPRASNRSVGYMNSRAAAPSLRRSFRQAAMV